MKEKSLTKAAIFIGISVSICPVGNALSHQLINSLTAASAADHFLVTCGEKENHHLTEAYSFHQLLIGIVVIRGHY